MDRFHVIPVILPDPEYILVRCYIIPIFWWSLIRLSRFLPSGLEITIDRWIMTKFCRIQDL